MRKLEQTEKILRGLVDAGWMGSYALLVRHGSEKAAITGKNVDADTLFEVASLTKVTVTAPLAMMSIAEGKLALEDHLGDFFSGLTVMRDVTVFRLLTHTSGIGAIPFSFVLTDRGSQAVAAAICRARPDYAPGTDQQYSCMGFITLGAILEQIYGKMLGGRKTVICKFLGTGMISVMPVPLLSVHPRECSQRGHIRYVPSAYACRWTCRVLPHKPPLQAL